MGKANPELHKVTHYELLANLGWSYWGQDKIDLAQKILENAIALEEELQELEKLDGAEYRLSLPHFYLAQIYEEDGELALAQQQWEESLRFLDPTDWRHSERVFIAQQHLQSLLDKQP